MFYTYYIACCIDYHFVLINNFKELFCKTTFTPRYYTNATTGIRARLLF